jgi:hypothetical protein
MAQKVPFSCLDAQGCPFSLRVHRNQPADQKAEIRLLFCLFRACLDKTDRLLQPKKPQNRKEKEFEWRFARVQ